MGNYDPEAYYRSEWEGFSTQPERQRVSLAAVAGRQVSNVLDVGCGAGQELLPFVTELGATGVGVDISPEAVRIASRRFAKLGYTKQVEFRCCPAESLPFEPNSFDVVMCRLALPYTLNQAALSEMARVLRPGGLLILKIHHLHYYLRRFRRGLAKGQAVNCLLAVRVLLAGTLYLMTGRQPDNRILGREVFQTRWMLRRVLPSVGLAIVKEFQAPFSNPWTPLFLIEKQGNHRDEGEANRPRFPPR